ncbi:MAG: diguanylate cyclase [Desulfotalea sp.]
MWDSPFYSFDKDISELRVTKDNDKHYIELHFKSSGNKPEVFNGLGIEGSYSVPESGNLSFEWMSIGESPNVQIFLSDGSPATQKSGVGEQFYHALEIPGKQWQKASIPLSIFKRNTWQPENAPTDGFFHTNGISAIEFGLEPEIALELKIRNLKFTWSTHKNQLLFIHGVFFFLGIFLFSRFAMDPLLGKKYPDFLLTSISIRLAYCVCAIGILVPMLTASPIISVHVVILYTIYAFIILLDNLIPFKVHTSKCWSLRYLLAFIVFFLAFPPLDLLSFIVLSFVALIFIATLQNRPFFLLISLVTFGTLLVHPHLNIESDIRYMVVIVVNTLIAYLILEYRLNRKIRHKMERIATLYEGVFAHSTDAIYTVTLDGTIIDANWGLGTLVGISEEKLSGQNIKEFIHHSDHHKLNNTDNSNSTKIRRYDADFLTPAGIVHHAYITEHPIISDNELIGFQIISSDITDRLQMEKELKEANEKLQVLAMLDALTSLYNRRYFDSAFAKEWQRCQRKKSQITIILCDIDFFKLYNDTYGHQAGDNCLIKVAKAIKDAVGRSEDVVARYGGEEFIIILPESTTAMAQSIAESILGNVCGLQIEHKSSEVEKYVTISLGVASITPTFDKSPDSLIKQADEALYLAKDNGKNRSFFATRSQL